MGRIQDLPGVLLPLVFGFVPHKTFFRVCRLVCSTWRASQAKWDKLDGLHASEEAHTVLRTVVSHGDVKSYTGSAKAFQELVHLCSALESVKLFTKFSWLDLSLLPNLRKLFFNDNKLEGLSSLLTLEELNTGTVICHDNEIRHIASLPLLRILVVRLGWLSQSGLQTFVTLQNLQYLDIRDMIAAVIPNLHRLENLHSLALCFTTQKDTNFDLTSLSKAKQLRKLTLLYIDSEDIFVTAAEQLHACKNLTQIDLVSVRMDKAADLTGLPVKSISSWKLTDDLVYDLYKFTPLLETLDLSRIQQCQTFEQLPAFENVQCVLVFSSDYLTDQHLQHVAHMPHLQTVHLFRCPNITQAGLEALESAPALRVVYVWACENLTCGHMKNARVEFALNNWSTPDF